MMRPTPERLAEMMNLLDVSGMHSVAEDFKAEIDALRQERDALSNRDTARRWAWAQHDEAEALAARARELEAALQPFHGQLDDCLAYLDSLPTEHRDEDIYDEKVTLRITTYEAAVLRAALAPTRRDA